HLSPISIRVPHAWFDKRCVNHGKEVRPVLLHVGLRALAHFCTLSSVTIECREFSPKKVERELSGNPTLGAFAKKERSREASRPRRFCKCTMSARVVELPVR